MVWAFEPTRETGRLARWEPPIDVYAPCALGGALDDEVVAILSARIVCGAANNQLAHEGIEKQLENRGVLYAPGTQTVDVSLSRWFPIWKVRLQFRAEIFNWLNHPEWSGPSTDWRSSNFGQVTGKSSNTREMQFSARISF